MQTQRKKMHAKGEEKQTWRRRSCSNIESMMVAWYVFVYFKPFPFVLYLHLFLTFSFLYVFVTLSTGSCTFFSPVLQILFAEKMEQRAKVNSCFFLVSPLFFSSFLFFSFSSTVCLPDLIATQGWRRNSLCSLHFFSHNYLPLLCFLSFFFCFSALSSFYLLLLARLVKGLYSLITALI